MYRLLCGLLLAAASFLAHAAAVTGVAFVHGTGKQTNAYQDYWQPAMVDSVRQGLSNPANVLVVNCDFTQYMWDSRAAGCLAQQLTDFINSRGITRLVVITHSMDVVEKIKAVATTLKSGHQDVPVEDVVIEKAEIVE